MRPWDIFIIEGAGQAPQVLAHARQSGHSIFILTLHYFLVPVTQDLKIEFSRLYIYIFLEINIIEFLLIPF